MPVSAPFKKVHNDNESYSIQTPHQPPKLKLMDEELSASQLEGTSGMAMEFLKMYLMVEKEIESVSCLFGGGRLAYV